MNLLHAEVHEQLVTGVLNLFVGRSTDPLGVVHRVLDDGLVLRELGRGVHEGGVGGGVLRRERGDAWRETSGTGVLAERPSPG